MAPHRLSRHSVRAQITSASRSAHLSFHRLIVPSSWAVTLGFFVAAVAPAVAPALASAQHVDPSQLSGLSYRHIGPDGNRVISVLGEPGNPLVMYSGGASGGLFKTEDGGVRWFPIFDDQEVSSVSALAMAPSDHNQVWAGTGETFLIRPAHAMGDGIYKSTDAGASWANVGLEETGRIGRIRVHPTNPDIVYACALGHTYGPQATRGVYRTEDGGDNWELVLHVSEESGCIDLALDSNNPRFLYASIWDVHINTWGLNSGGPPACGALKTVATLGRRSPRWAVDFQTATNRRSAKSRSKSRRVIPAECTC
jgi:hypothetical protein